VSERLLFLADLGQHQRQLHPGVRCGVVPESLIEPFQNRDRLLLVAEAGIRVGHLLAHTSSCCDEAIQLYQHLAGLVMAPAIPVQLVEEQQR
jgi:hypothetical protein